MKRNRKAEARRDQRKLNRHQTQLKHISILLTEMETASIQVMTEQFTWTPEQAQEFMALLRSRFLAFKNDYGLFRPEQQLKIIAQRFAIAGMQILSEVHQFSPEQMDAWVKGMIEQGNKNRAENQTNVQKSEVTNG